MLYDICSGQKQTDQNMLYNMCHVMLYNMRHVMLYNICHVMLCYDITCVMLRYMTYVQDRNKQIRTCYVTCVMLYNMCHVMLYNICHVMLYNNCHVMLRYVI